MSQIKVIGAVWPKTGSTTICAALNHLGYHTYHFDECFANTLAGKNDAAKWVKAFQAKERRERLPKAFWEDLFKGYDCLVDGPACCFYQELMEIYPDAKVLLTTRDGRKWVASFKETIGKPEYDPFFRFCYQFSFWINSKLPEFLPMIDFEWQDLIYNRDKTLPVGRLTDAHEPKLIKVFEGLIEEVQRVVPREKLLKYEVKQGWEPLCDFLGKKVPDIPFPHVNDTAEMKKMLNKMYFYPVLFLICMALSVIFVLYLIFEY